VRSADEGTTVGGINCHSQVIAGRGTVLYWGSHNCGGRETEKREDIREIYAGGGSNKKKERGGKPKTHTHQLDNGKKVSLVRKNQAKYTIARFGENKLHERVMSSIV